MANMTVNQRNQYERATHGNGEALNRVGPAGRRALALYTVVALCVLAALTTAAVQVYDGWHHAIVIADMALVFFGIAAWVYPQRKHA